MVKHTANVHCVLWSCDLNIFAHYLDCVSRVLQVFLISMKAMNVGRSKLLIFGYGKKVLLSDARVNS
jgi:hypothetical protein